ncbi:hypothetical protein [uncultured Marivita sp.]|nr:hypothetical protein [uncultured Marivita sp.]MCR9110987.1 hypothetical protein [Paracoccaceae bacterium]
MIDKTFQFDLSGFEHICRPQFSLRLDLRQMLFSCFDELRAF